MANILGTSKQTWLLSEPDNVNDSIWYAYKPSFEKSNDMIKCIKNTYIKINKNHLSKLKDYEKHIVNIGDSFKIKSADNEYYLIKNNLVNLLYFKDKSQHGNFGDELSKFIISSLINKDKYNLFFNKQYTRINIIGIGSYIHMAKNNSYIFGSGVRTKNNIEGGHKYNNLNVCAVRGPLTKQFLEEKGIYVPDVFGDPSLLLPRFYTPVINYSLKNKIGLVPHKSNYSKYLNCIDVNKFYLINPSDQWETVINNICSCKCIISSSLHGLICSDAYNIPNLWLDEFKLLEGDFKFKDYFQSQKREYVKINNLNQFDEKLLYNGDNNINLEKLINSFPFTH